VGLRPYLEEDLTVSTTATRLPVANLVEVVEVEVYVLTGGIRMRLDGTNPTSTAGPYRQGGYARRLTAHEAAQARFIRDVDHDRDVTVQATYYRRA
jgi:hypothetical protein